MLSICWEPAPKELPKVNPPKLYLSNREVKCPLPGELLIIVEYCRYGNLQTYLSKHRDSFISLLDDFGNMKTDSEIEELKASILPEIPSSDRNSIALSGIKSYFKMNSLQLPTIFKTIPGRSSVCSGHFQSPEWWHNNQQRPDGTLNKIISTRDLISWSFQVARGMDYLSSKKVRAPRRLTP